MTIEKKFTILKKWVGDSIKTLGIRQTSRDTGVNTLVLKNIVDQEGYNPSLKTLIKLEETAPFELFIENDHYEILEKPDSL